MTDSGSVDGTSDSGKAGNLPATFPHRDGPCLDTRHLLEELSSCSSASYKQLIL